MLLTKLRTDKSQKSINIISLFSVIFIISYASVSLATEPYLSESTSENNENNQVGSNDFSSFYYLGGKIGNNTYQDGCESWSINCKENDLAMGIFGGYQLNQYIAFEAAYLKLGEAEATYLETGVEQTYIGSMRGFEFSALAEIKLTERFAAFAKAGTFNWFGENNNNDISHDGYSWAPTAGLGLSYQISHAWQARFEYQYFHELGNTTLGSSSSHLTTLGVSYRFGEDNKPLKQKQTMPIKNTTPAVAKPAPMVVPVVAKPNKVLPAQKLSILFAFDKSKLDTPQALYPVITQLKQYPQSKVILKGFTDAKGSAEYNLTLSEKRVNTIKRYLITQGVSAEQISSHYFGERSPLFDNSTAEHRNKNRRVLVLMPKVTLNESADLNNTKQGAAQ